MNIYTPYFYIIQDTLNGMYYAGAKWAVDANPDNFMIEGGYTTSSNTIKSIIEKDGLDRFNIKKIKTFENKHETCCYETKFLQRVNARQNIFFYNGHNNDGIFCTEKLKFITELIYGDGITNISQTAYWKESIRKNKDVINAKRLETIEENWDDNFREVLKIKKQQSWKKSPKLEIHRQRTRQRRIQEEAKKSVDEKKALGKIISNSYWSRTPEQIETHQNNKSKSLKQTYIDNPDLRKAKSENAKGRISINKNGKNRRVKPEEVDHYYADGWVYGSIQNRKNIKPSCLGKKAVNKDGKALFITIEQIDEYLNNGWKLGLK